MKSEPDLPEEAKGIARLLAGLANLACRFPVPTLAAAALAAVVSLYAFCTRIELRTQRNDLVGAHKESQRRWRQYVVEFGSDDDLVVVVRGSDRQRMQAALDALAARIRQRPELFDRLFYRVDLRALRDRALLFLPAERIAAIQANLRSMSLLLDFAPFSWQALSLHSLVTEAQLRAARLSPGVPPDPGDEQFLGQLSAVSAAAAATLTDPSLYSNPWHSLLPSAPGQPDLLAEPQYFFSGDGVLAFLLVRPVKDEGSFTAAETSVNALRAVVDEVRPAFADLEFGLTGLPVLETDEMVASRDDTQLASWLALAGVAVLYLLFFRGVRSPFLTLMALLAGTAWAMGWLTLTVGHLNILSATFVMMLIGLGDYGVLWVTRYEQERSAGAGMREAQRRTAAGVGPGVLTAAITTALAFYAAMLADFVAVAELGWIAGSGVLLCALSTFTVLPALLALVDRPKPVISYQLSVISKRQGISSVSTDHCSLITDHCSLITDHPAWLPAVARRPRWVIAVGAVLTLVLGTAAAWGVRYDHNLLNLQARGLESVRWERTLIEHTAGASWHALSYTASAEEALALKRRFEELPEVSGVVEVASLVPAGQEEKLEQLRDIQCRLRALPERGRTIPHPLPDPAKLDDALGVLLARLEPLTAARPQLAALRAYLADFRGRLRATPAAVAAVRLRDFEQRLAGDLAEDLHRLRDVSTPEPITAADLPPELRERYIGVSGKWLLRVFGKECLWDHAPLAHFVDVIRRVDPEATGKPFTTLEGLEAMKDGFQGAALYALVAIVLVLLLDFRNLRHTLAALLPLGVGLVVSLGLLALCGVPLNPANMIAFPLILGVGVDNGVHVLHDYREAGRARGYALRRTTGQGILLAALTTVLGFGTLMASSHRGLVGLGLILTLGVTCCMLASLVFLPAVLHVLGTRRPPAVPNQSEGAPSDGE